MMETTMETMMSPTDVATSILEQQGKEVEATRVLLDRQTHQKDRLMVQKAEMGGTNAYLGSVTLEWLSQRVRFAHQLPLFREMRRLNEANGSPSIILDRVTIDEVMQRPLDWSRQAPLAQYLASREWHKFGPVLVVVTQKWVDDPEAPEWDEHGRATRASVDFTPLDKDGSVGLLNASEEYFIYALDGQHRLMGIQGLMEFIRTGQLVRRRHDGKPTSSVIKAEDLEVDQGALQSLSNERIGVEFIAAVLPGETREQSKRRVRSIFVHLNMMAASLSKGQLVQLNEDDGFSIVARGVAVSHPLLAKEGRVDFSTTSISTRATTLTTLQTLKEMATNYLQLRYPEWTPTEKGLIPLRPADSKLEDGIKLFNELINYLQTLPSFKRLNQGDKAPALRNFGFDDPAGEAHMLFRPVGQAALADAIGVLVFERGFDLDALFEKLRKYDAAGGFNLEDPTLPWYRVLYDPSKGRMSVRGRSMATELLTYLLGNGIEDPEKREDLRERFAAERQYDDGIATNLNNESVLLDDIELPPAL